MNGVAARPPRATRTRTVRVLMFVFLLASAIAWMTWHVSRRVDADLLAPWLLRPLANLTMLVTEPISAATLLLGHPIDGRSAPALAAFVLCCVVGAWVVRRVFLAPPSVAQARVQPLASPTQESAVAASERQSAPQMLDRRAWLLRAGAGGVGVLGASASAHATLIEPQNLVIRRYRVPIASLPPSLDGVRIAVLTDTHIGPAIPEAFVARAVRMTIDLRPDMVLLGGDYISGSSRFVEPAARVFEPLSRELTGVPVLGVLGNHDWWSGGGTTIAAALERAGVRMIDNVALFWTARGELHDAPQSIAALAIVGLGDMLAHDTDVERAFARVPAGTPSIVLVHEPDAAEMHEVVAPGAPRIDLMICGHTHGGQVRLPLLGTPVVPSAFGSKYAGGMAQGPRCRVLTSRGVGMSWLPVRVGVPPEIVEITLSRAPA